MNQKRNQNFENTLLKQTLLFCFVLSQCMSHLGLNLNIFFFCVCVQQVTHNTFLFFSSANWYVSIFKRLIMVYVNKCVSLTKAILC